MTDLHILTPQTHLPRKMSTMLRRSGVGPLIVQTGSPSSNEQARTPRAARCETMPRIESLRSFQCRQVQQGKNRTLAIEGAPSVNSQRDFKSVSPVKIQRPKRPSSITREATDMPSQSRFHRTASPTLAFQGASSVNSYSQRHVKSVPSVKIQRPKRASVITSEVTEMPCRIHRTLSTEILEDFQTLKVRGSKTLEPRLFDHRLSLFLTVTKDIEIYDTESECTHRI